MDFSSLVLKRLTVRLAFLEVYMVLEKSLPPDKWPTLKAIFEIVERAEKLAPELPKDERVLPMRERIAVLTGRLAAVVKPQSGDDDDFVFH